MRTKNVVIALTLGAIFTLVPSNTAVGGYAASPVMAGVNSGVVGTMPIATAYPGAPGVETAPRSGQDSAITTARSEPWAKIDFSSRRLANNVWGAPANEMLTSGVYLNYDGSFGWDWNRPDPKIKPGQTCLRPIFPSVRIGASPWDPSNSAYFPIRLTDMKSLKLDVTYNYPSIPTGSYNLAYDMFLSDTNQPGSSPKPKAEVMIWLHSTFPQLPNTYRGDFTDGNNTYELYSFVMSGGRLYYSFAMKGQPQFQAQHTVNARRLMDNLPIDPGWYIHGVELGNEIVSGSGKIEISKFNVNLNGLEL